MFFKTAVKESHLNYLFTGLVFKLNYEVFDLIYIYDLFISLQRDMH